MARITVTPEEFTFVNFDAGEIARVASDVADAVGLPADFPVALDVDQTSPFGYNRVTFDGRSASVSVESGALENPKAPRTMSEEGTREFLARLFYRLRDRLDPDFGDPPDDDELTYRQRTAWDSYGLGRWERLGNEAGKRRREYHFRLRHGFNDVADAVFERLWTSDGLTWDDIEKACAETEQAQESVEAAS